MAPIKYIPAWLWGWRRWTQEETRRLGCGEDDQDPEGLKVKPETLKKGEETGEDGELRELDLEMN